MSFDRFYMSSHPIEEESHYQKEDDNLILFLIYWGPV